MKNRILAILLRRYKKILKYLNFNISIKINDKKIKIPLITMMGLNNLIELTEGREIWLDEILKTILKENRGIFIDVGVNTGQTLLKIKTIDINLNYIGFETNPSCCFYVDQLIEINKLPNCQIIPAGLSSRPALLKLFMKYGEDDPCASVVENYRKKSFYTSEKYVSVFDGDSLIRDLDIDAISIIKIDVEGGELEVIQGLVNTIAKYKPFFLCEILPIYDENSEIGSFRKIRQNSLEKILKEAGYLVARIYRDGKISILNTIETHSDLSLVDYIFIPPESEQFLKLLQR